MDIDGCTLHAGVCNGDPHATCSDGGVVDSRHCTWPTGHSGTATLRDSSGFDGCADIDGCSLHAGVCDGDAHTTCSDGSDVNYSGTATLRDSSGFNGCADIYGCTLHAGGGDGDVHATCSDGDAIVDVRCI